MLSVSAFKPVIDKILSEAGFPAGPDALTSLTSALAQHKAEVPAELPAPVHDVIPMTSAKGTNSGKRAPGTAP